MLNRLKVLVLLGFQVTSSLHLSGMQVISGSFRTGKSGSPMTLKRGAYSRYKKGNSPYKRLFKLYNKNQHENE
jgi:hypothetical protein